MKVKENGDKEEWSYVWKRKEREKGSVWDMERRAEISER
jgi:hypothetical protein